MTGRLDLYRPMRPVDWTAIRAEAEDASRISAVYLILMAVATMIAVVGVMLDQPILLIGAMVVGPDFRPLGSLSVGLGLGGWTVALRSVIKLVIGFAVGIAAATLLTLLLDAGGVFHIDQLVRLRATDFIWEPDALSWLIGFLAGIAGMVSLLAARADVLIGVLISVTTIPAAANAAAGIAYLIDFEAYGSLAQLGINAVAIVVGATLTLLIARLTPAGRGAGLART
jgi:uncharacterized hydrophobic protein (TIGR00271 family)